MSFTKSYFAALAIFFILAATCWLTGQGSLQAESPHVVSTVFTPGAQVAEKKLLQTVPTDDKKSPAIFDVSQPDNLVQRKYAILFSALQLSSQTREQLQLFLQEREAIAARSFYDTNSNSAEIAENLRQRELAVAAVDNKIGKLLTEEDARKYELLKDSTYEQALLAGFYQVAGMDRVPEQQKLNMLLGKLEQKQKIAELTASTGEQIANATPATKLFLIEKTRKAFIASEEDYLRTARAGLSDEQYELLQHYEQQLSDERWQDLLSSWQ